MDYVSRQFAFLAKKLRKELRQGLTTLHRDLEKYIKAINKHVARQDETQQAQNRLLEPPIRVNAETHETEAAERENHTRRNRNLGVQIVLTIGTWAAFLAALYYAGIAKGQLKEMIRARRDTRHSIEVAERGTKIAEDALEESRQSFRISDRPYVWLADEPKSATPGPVSGQWMNWDQDTHKASWSFHFRNYGRSPAINVRFDRSLAVGPNAWWQIKWHEINTPGDVLPPNGGNWVTAFSTEQMSHQEYRTYFATFRNFVVFGHVEYDGLDGTSYWSEYCFFNGKGVAIENCPSHNIIE